MMALLPPAETSVSHSYGYFMSNAHLLQVNCFKKETELYGNISVIKSLPLL